MTDIGELTVRISADASQMQQQLSSATQSTKQAADQMVSSFDAVKASFEAIGIGLSVGGIVEFGKSALEAANNLYILSQRTGFAASTLSALNIPLQQNGSSVDEFSSAMKFMSRNLENAGPPVIKAFDDIGLSITKLRALTPEQQFYAIAQGLGQITDQGKLTADTMAIFGRGAQGLIPIIKESGGNIEDMVASIKKMGGALTDDEIKKVHEYDDAWVSLIEHLKMFMVDGVVAYHDFFDGLGKEIDDSSQKLGEWLRLQAGLGPKPTSMPGTLPPNASYNRPSSVSQATVLKGYSINADGSLVAPNKAAGNNNDINPPATPKDNELDAYIEKLKEESAAADVSQKELFIRRAEIEAGTKAQQDFSNNLRDTQDLTDEETQTIRDNAGALYDHAEALKLNKEIGDQLSTSLEKIAMNFKDLKSAVTDFLHAVASQILKSQVTTPLGNSISGLLSSTFGSGTGGGIGNIFSSIGGVLGFASGGSPPVGVPSIVGENGPELFVPNTAGTVIPNGQFGGSQVVVQQSINLSPGLAETVNAAILNAAPGIAAMAHAGVMKAIQSGGAESKIVGLRS